MRFPILKATFLMIILPWAIVIAIVLGLIQACDAIAAPRLSEHEAWPAATREARDQASYQAHRLKEPHATYQITLRRRNTRNRITFNVHMAAGPHTCSFRIRVRQYRTANGLAPDAARPGTITTHTYLAGKIAC